MEMGDRIKERRLAMGYTQEELATKLGLQKSAIAKYENGRVENIKRSTIANMSRILECRASYLMGWDDESITTASHLSDAELLSEIQAVYGLSTKEAVELFNKLDTMDKGAAIERMRIMLEDKKYLGKEGLLSG